MASSFSNQIPAVIYLLQQLRPKSVLDIGKGFGKYGFLIHEYVGINNQKRIISTSSMAEQSEINIDAVEVDEDLMLSHLDQFYSQIFVGDVLGIYQELGDYELILMIDVIEHLNKANAVDLLKYFLSKSAVILIATPLKFFEQKFYGSKFEDHISHWLVEDFRKLGFVEFQYFEGGGVYLLSNKKINIRGFGNSLIKKSKRILRFLRNEIYP